MTLNWPSSWIPALALVGSVACAMPNPDFDGLAEDDETGVGDGDGDGDPTTTGPGDGDGDSSTTGDGDGDGDPSTGDGDGDPSTGDGDPDTGDGDGDTLVCDPGLEECDGACTDLDWSASNCGECGNACDPGLQCGFGQCLPKRYLFVTSVLLPGGFGGLGEASGFCNELAANAQLPGAYAAWLGDIEASPISFLPNVDAAYTTRNGQVVAWSWEDLIDGELSGHIDRNEFGELIAPSPVEECGLEYAVWTGATNNGLTDEPNCQFWSLATESAVGTVGDPKSSTAWSQTNCLASCWNQLPVYCVQIQ